ncbi:hypothetical protein Taro_019935 [Colocasia esculenta]|uniref:[RNA-polymerase]-subunit kinase n=1 Tax=Colocasia esculenta TaxID=4460 RepID=A0A843V0P9_COLES|nr:hypothetical protein [Colocasia esculenta]
MGCIASKHAVSVTPALDHSGAIRDQSQGGILASSLRNRAAVGNLEKKKHGDVGPDESTESGKTSSNGASSLSFRLQNLHKYMEGEQVAAGWPAWLSAVAGEAIQGWVPLKSDSFEKLEKIGQGTYSSVFQAREIETGKIVALKKVRFDNYEPESVRFMAREIQILRRLEHPNIVKLEGLITSRLSCSIYLVFEYMEHDLAGLSSCPDIQFTESQVKCYLHQLLSGLQHCHSRGIMHRDIKGANLLVNNEGILKIADFGLANFSNPGRKHPLTSRVVTLWYRPPELLLGSTDYGASVDLWSVGCVFAELLLGKPILQGRTEVEQLHKIFKLCGSPPDEYWKKSKLPHATIFKPHQPYENCLRETCKSLPGHALGLIESLLSVEPYKRGTASSALESEYFASEPYACEPSSLPKYPPNKEIDAKGREESRRKKAPGRAHGSKAARGVSRASRPMREPNGLSRLASRADELKTNSHGVKNGSLKHNPPSKDGDSRLFVGLQPVSTIKQQDETLHIKHSSGEDIPFSGPLLFPTSGGFSWAKKTKESNECMRSNSKRSSKAHQSGALDPSSILQARNTFDSKELADGEPLHEHRVSSKGHEPKDLMKRAMLKQWKHLERPDSFDASEGFHSQELSEDFYFRDEVSSRRSYLNYQQDQEDRVEFSGPLLSQSCKVDELLAKHERHIRQAVRRFWFQRGTMKTAPGFFEILHWQPLVLVWEQLLGYNWASSNITKKTAALFGWC